MKTLKIGPITLAITLISLGVLIILSNMFKFNLLNYFISIFAIILISLGLEIVITNYSVKRKNTDINTKIDGKSIFILIIIIIFTFLCLSINYVFYLFKDLDLGNININDIIQNELNIYKYREVKEYEVNPTNLQQILLINNPNGSVSIDSNTEKLIKVRGEILLPNKNKDEAGQLADSIISINKTEKQIEINSMKYENTRINYIISIPENLELQIKNGFGDVMVNKTKNDVNILNEHGKVNIDDIYGKVKIENKHGNIIASNIQKDVQINSEFCDININNIFGKVDMVNRHGNITIKSVNESVKVINKYGYIHVDDVDSDIDLSNIHDNIKANHISGNSKINLEFGNIELSELEKGMYILSKHSDIIINNEKFKENISMSNEFGDITVNLLDKDDKYNWNVRTKFGVINFKSNSTQEQINIDNSSNITIQINNSNGDIDIK